MRLNMKIKIFLLLLLTSCITNQLLSVKKIPFIHPLDEDIYNKQTCDLDNTLTIQQGGNFGFLDAEHAYDKDTLKETLEKLLIKNYGQGYVFEAREDLEKLWKIISNFYPFIDQETLILAARKAARVVRKIDKLSWLADRKHQLKRESQDPFDYDAKRADKIAKHMQYCWPYGDSKGDWNSEFIIAYKIALRIKLCLFSQIPDKDKTALWEKLKGELA